MAGGDVTKVVHYHPTVQKSALSQLAEGIALKYKNDPLFKDYIEDLKHYVDAPVGKELKGLEQKLSEAGISASEIIYAIKSKEKFAKKLYRLQFSENAQLLLSHILAKIEVTFQRTIFPTIQKGCSTEVRTESVLKLINELYEEVGSCGLLDMQDLEGMLYFLTGNCHVEWL